MKLGMRNSKIWKNCISAMSTLVQEAAFVVSPEGLKLKAMDPSHVALVDLDLPAKVFDNFDVKEATTIGVNLMEMNRVMSRAKPDDQLTIELADSHLALTFSGASERHFSVPVVDVEPEDLPEPKLELTAEVEVTAGIVQDGVKDAELVGDTVKIEASKNGIRIYAESDRGSSELKLGAGNKALPKLDVKAPAQAGYQVKYLGDILRGCHPADTIGIRLGTDLPILVEYPIADGKLRFLLAPRINTK